MSKDSMKKSQGPSFRLHGCSRPQWGITLWQEPQKEWSLSVLDRVNIWAKWERKLRGRNYHGLVVCILSRFSSVQLFATLWTVARQAPLSMGFSRQQYWSGLPFPSPGNLLTKWSKPASLTSYSLAGRFFTTRATWKAHHGLVRNL